MKVFSKGVDAMDIAALSISMSQSQLSQNVSLALMRKVMDTSTVNSQQLIKMMELSANPDLGSNIDLKA